MSGVTALLRRETPVLVGLVVTAAMLVGATTRTFALTNIGVQLTLFVLIACVPAWRTGRMSYVDIAWPFGLVALGVQTLLLGDGSPFVIAVATIYLVMGGRMGLGAVAFWRMGEFDHELPRYRYQRLRWERASFGSERRDLVAEVLVQCGANIGMLGVPAALAVASQDRGLGVVSLIGIVVWGASFVLESVADAHKLAFVTASKKQGVKRSCDVGLWRYSRHPNYFFQWMQWNAIVLVCSPAALELVATRLSVTSVVTALGLLGASAIMYWCLVHYTGAVPAEHFSVQSRPDYAAYQARTNRFFPAPPSAP